MDKKPITYESILRKRSSPDYPIDIDQYFKQHQNSAPQLKTFKLLKSERDTSEDWQGDVSSMILENWPHGEQPREELRYEKDERASSADDQASFDCQEGTYQDQDMLSSPEEDYDKVSIVEPIKWRGSTYEVSNTRMSWNPEPNESLFDESDNDSIFEIQDESKNNENPVFINCSAIQTIKE